VKKVARLGKLRFKKMEGGKSQKRVSQENRHEGGNTPKYSPSSFNYFSVF